MRDFWLQIVVVVLLPIFVHLQGVAVKREGIPRFKHSARLNHYNYLGDTVKLRCLAVGKPVVKVHWFRNDVYLDFKILHNHNRYSEDPHHMTLEIKNIQLSDKGEWRCRVWNQEGSKTRIFNLHIIDFCDYFLNYNYTVSLVPLECVCQWKMLKFSREGIDFELITEDICKPFKKDNENVIFHRRPSCIGEPCSSTVNYEKLDFDIDLNNTLLYRDVSSLVVGVNPLSITVTTTPESNSVTETTVPSSFPRKMPVVPRIANGPKILDPIKMFDYLVESGFPDIGNLLPGLHTTADLEYLREALANWDPNSEFDAKLQDMKTILRGRPSVVSSETPYVSIDGEKVTLYPLKAPVVTTIEKSSVEEANQESKVDIQTTTPSESMPTTTRSGWWPGPQKLINIAPYFAQATYHLTEPIIAPSGKTIKLSCRAHGIPKPLVIWYKDGTELEPDSERFTAAKYRFANHLLEMEDAVESDSGHYTCEVYNKHGTIKREFEVRVVDRSRTKPIIIPNVLINQTVDVNSTVNFTCKVVSDTLPYFTWAKLLNINGSYINYTDPKRPQFNLIDVHYLDLKNIQRIKVYRDTRRTVLSIKNASLADQGIYSCIAGTSLGVTMANATLTVNEFRPKTLPTDPIPPPTDFQFILFFGLIFLAVAILAAVITYIVCQRRQSKNRIQNLDKMGVFKKVVITKKTPKDGEIWPDLASSYAITIESVVRKHELENSALDEGNRRYEVPTDPKWEIDRRKLDIQNKLGEGAFGEVWQATLQKDDNGIELMPIAVKKLKESAGDKELIILVGEMQIFKSIGEHRNVLKLIGCCTGIGELFVVLELCPYGNLRSFLQSHRPVDAELHSSDINENSLNYMEPRNSMYQQQNQDRVIMKKLMLRDLIRFAAEIARGMEFLAAKKIIHRDLAARNVLVAENFTMKISDFGLSRNVIHNDYYRKHGNGNLPIKWMAPESLDENRHIYTTMSDVWSYGIIVWEIMTLGEQPYRNIPMGVLYERLMQGYRMEAPPKCPEEIYSVMKRCWREIPEERPSFQVIADYFEAILNSATTYQDEQLSESSYRPTDTENDEGPIIYDSPRRNSGRALMATTVDNFDDFVDKGDYQNTDVNTPLLGEERSPPERKRKKQVLKEPFYFNVQHGMDPSPSWNDKGEMDGDSDALTSGTSRRSSDAHSNSMRRGLMDHDYVNDELSRSKHSSSKSSKCSNPNGVRHSQFSDSSAFELELGAVIYSSPPSKKSSTSNLSVGVTQPIPQSPRTSSRNGFIQRSYSTESQTSSGRGGSSAIFSSAEGIGGLGELCQIEYTSIDIPRPVKPSSSVPKKSTTRKS